MSNSDYKSIDVLCQEQLSFVQTGLQLTYSRISQELLKDVCEGTDSKLDSLEGQYFTDYLLKLLIYEEAYESIELRQLDYNSKFLVKTNSQWDEDEKKIIKTEYLHLRNSPTPCCHYDYCKAYVLGSDCRLDTIADMRFRGELKLERAWSILFCNRLRGSLATIKLSPRNPLVMHGYSAIRHFKHLQKEGDEDQDDGRNSAGNYKIVDQMFKFDYFTPVHTARIHLRKPYRGDSFRENGIKGSIEAKISLASVRPYIMCTNAWSDETDWLECLVQNINHIKISEIGILCPDDKTMEQIKNRPNYGNLSVRIGTLDVWPESSFDYLIIYKAHSIGPAEAIKPLMTVKSDGCVVLVGDPKMPNLRVRSRGVRNICGSILQWFYDKNCYPEYFEEESVCISRSPVCFGYSPKIFSIFNKMFYADTLANMTVEFGADKVDHDSMIFHSVQGKARMSGCSPYNLAEAGACLESVKELIKSGINGRRIGVLTTYCAQKKKIANLIHGESQCSNVKIGILEDFEDKTYDCLIISTVETSDRACSGKRYPFDDLVYDTLCFNLALTRAKKKIILIGDKNVLGRVDHWAHLIDLCVKRTN